MGYVHFLQGSGSAAYSGDMSPSRIPKYKSSIALGLILFAHAILIFIFLNGEIKQKDVVPGKILHMINVLPESEDDRATPKMPIVNEHRAVSLDVPVVEFSESASSLVNILINEISRDVLAEPSDQYSNVFDPKMRKKLMDSRGFNRPRLREESVTWVAIDGRTFIEMGDGNCLVSMPKVDSRDRGTSWGMTTCGKNDSERAMERVIADFKSRK